MSKIAIWEKMNGMRNGNYGIGFVLKIPLITTHEQQMGINDTIPNDHAWYLLFMIIHYCSYFILKIKLFYLICTIKFYLSARI